MAKKKTGANKGYTLIEMLVYIAVLAFISAIVVNSIALMINSFGEAKLLSKINSSADTALERILRDAKASQGIDDGLSVFVSSPGELVLNLKIDPLETRRFYVENGRIMVSENGEEGAPLTSSDLSVSSLVFYSIEPPGVSRAIKIEMEIQASRGSRNFSEKFYGTAILRGSY